MTDDDDYLDPDREPTFGEEVEYVRMALAELECPPHSGTDLCCQVTTHVIPTIRNLLASLNAPDPLPNTERVVAECISDALRCPEHGINTLPLFGACAGCVMVGHVNFEVVNIVDSILALYSPVDPFDVFTISGDGPAPF